MASWKIGAGLATLLYGEYLFDKGKFNQGAKNTLIKAGILTCCIPFANDTVGNVVRQVPVLGGFLSDPVDNKDGKEQKNIGALLRFLIPYIAIREAAVKKYLIK